MAVNHGLSINAMPGSLTISTPPATETLASGGKTESQTLRCSPVPIYPAYARFLCNHSCAGQATWFACQTIDSQRSCCMANSNMENTHTEAKRSALKTPLKPRGRPLSSVMPLERAQRATDWNGVLQSVKVPNPVKSALQLQQSIGDRLGIAAQVHTVQDPSDGPRSDGQTK